MKQKLDAVAPIANASQSKGTDKNSSKKKGDAWELKKAKCTAYTQAETKTEEDGCTPERVRELATGAHARVTRA